VSVLGDASRQFWAMRLRQFCMTDITATTKANYKPSLAFRSRSFINKGKFNVHYRFLETPFMNKLK
jgi:hypothetical protein